MSNKKADPKRDNEETTDVESCPNEPVGNETTEKAKAMGNRRCTRIVIASIIFVVVAAAIAVAVIYGRPPSWKKYRDFSENGGDVLEFSHDGTILAVGSTIYPDQSLDGVKVYDVQSGDQIGQRIPFFDINDPTLPKADYWSRRVYVLDQDFSLSSDGRTLVVSSVTISVDRTGLLCGGDGLGRWCNFARVSVYDFDGSQWINSNNGPIYEHLVPTSDGWYKRTLRAALSGDKSTLATWTDRIISDGAVGANIMMFVRDEDTGEYMEDIGNSIHIDKIWYPAVSLSMNEVGSRIAIGGFDEVEVYDYNAQNDKWENTPGPAKMDGYLDGYQITSAVLSNSGSRMAVSMGFNGNNFGDEKPDYVRVYQWTTTGDGWVQIGNSMEEKLLYNGLTMSGDGKTISMSRGIDRDENNNLREHDSSRTISVFRLAKNEEEWMKIGIPVTGTFEYQNSALSYDGNRIATGPVSASWTSWTDKPFVTVYDLRRGI